MSSKDGVLQTITGGCFEYETIMDDGGSVAAGGVDWGRHEHPLPTVPFKEYKYATSYGWITTKGEYEATQDPEERLYNLDLDQGGGFIADGFVIYAGNCKLEDIKDTEWNPPKK